MAYTIGNIPADAPSWLVQELRNIQLSQSSAVDGVTYRTLYAEPSVLREGLTVLADGTIWDPNSGAGLYIYRGAAWHFLG